ncbi:MAG TPA: hypothetical protein EYQ51_06080 [Alphaproteobacteria bacterium]|nr:hypothetical protein [Alphaproteobacteria bacterium]
MTINEEYLKRCKTRSDINEHLPILREYALRSKSVAELGVRKFVSTYAFLDGCDNVIGVDIEAQEQEYEECKYLCKREGKNFEYIIQDSLKVDIPEVDFLFIDTWHNGDQLRGELKRHHSKARKFIGFHDTTSYAAVGETPYDKIQESGQFSGEGIWKAIEEFLEENPEWTIDLKLENNNGLTILTREEK